MKLQKTLDQLNVIAELQELSSKFLSILDNNSQSINLLLIAAGSHNANLIEFECVLNQINNKIERDLTNLQTFTVV